MSPTCMHCLPFPEPLLELSLPSPSIVAQARALSQMNPLRLSPTPFDTLPQHTRALPSIPQAPEWSSRSWTLCHPQLTPALCSHPHLSPG